MSLAPFPIRCNLPFQECSDRNYSGYAPKKKTLLLEASHLINHSCRDWEHMAAQEQRTLLFVEGIFCIISIKPFHVLYGIRSLLEDVDSIAVGFVCNQFALNKMRHF